MTSEKQIAAKNSTKNKNDDKEATTGNVISGEDCANNDEEKPSSAAAAAVIGETDESSGPQTDRPAGRPPLSIETKKTNDMLSTSQHSNDDDDNDNDAMEDSFSSVPQQQLQTQTSESTAKQKQPPQSHPQHRSATLLPIAAEHKIFLAAILDLLTERDRHAPKVGMNDPNILKCGPLKKASQIMNGVWKVKYVEIRRGMFSYYENSSSSNDNNGTRKQQSSLNRKNVPLEASTARCRAVKLHQKALNLTLDGAIFEVTTDGGNTKRLWMANSREERQAWMQAIHSARVGGSLTRSDSVQNFATTTTTTTAAEDEMGNNADPTVAAMTTAGNGNSATTSAAAAASSTTATNAAASNTTTLTTTTVPSPKHELRTFRRTQHHLGHAKTKSEYLSQLRELQEQPLVIPVKWVAKQQQPSSSSQAPASSMDIPMDGGGNTGDAFREESVNLSIVQLWRDLQRDTISINGEIFSGGTGHEPEKMMGALTRQLLSFATTSNHQQRISSSSLSEAQAIEYARDVLLSGNRTRSGGDSYFCVTTLCQNPDLVVIVPSAREVEPVHITVAPAPTGAACPFDDKSGWLKSRSSSKLQRTWRKLFFVMSEGTLSYYERAHPRPHRLRGQLDLKDATLTITRKANHSSSSNHNSSGNGSGNNNSNDMGKPLPSQFILQVTSKEGSSRVLLFETEDRLLDWTYALETTARAGSVPTTAPSSTSTTSKLLRGHRRRGSHELASSSSTGPNANSNNNNTSNPNQQQQNLTNAASDTVELLPAEAATMEHFAKLGIHAADFVQERLAVLAKKVSYTTIVSIRASTEYNICTADPQGDTAVDTWATLRAEFLQSFRVSGGPNGRIIRGEETVRLCVTECLADEDETTSPPSSPRRHRKGRIFRSLVGNDDEHEAALSRVAD